MQPVSAGSRKTAEGGERQCIADVPASWCMSPARNARVDGRATAPAVGPLGPYRNPLMGRIPDVSSETDWIGHVPPGRALNRKGKQAAGREPAGYRLYRVPIRWRQHGLETGRVILTPACRKKESTETRTSHTGEEEPLRRRDQTRGGSRVGSRKKAVLSGAAFFLALLFGDCFCRGPTQRARTNRVKASQSVNERTSA